MKHAFLNFCRRPRPGLWRKIQMAAVGVTALIMTAASASAQTGSNSEKLNMDFTFKAFYNVLQRSIDITAFSGCMSSGFRYLGNDISFRIDENTATISGSGKITYKNPTQPVMTADCGGATQFKFSLPNVERRRYSLIINGKYRGIVDFTKSTDPVVLDVPSRNRKNGFGTKARLAASYAPVSLANWKPRTAPSVLDLLRPITSTHPETLEGRPEMALTMRRDLNADSLMVRITNTGYLDDSVSGEKFAAIITRNAEGWYLDSLWRQNLCARGKNAGKWIKKACP